MVLFAGMILGNLLNGSPLRTKIGIWIALRIIAIGLVCFGWRVSENSRRDVRLCGGLILVAGVVLLAGVVELIGYG